MASSTVIRKLYIYFRNARDWLLAQLFFGVIAVLKLLPADRAIWFCEEAAKGLGPWYPRSRLARENLALAFPEKSPEEIEDILVRMWGNLGRTAAEYVYLDQIFDINEDDQSKGRVEIEGSEHFEDLKALDGPAICFTGHTGNWEILPIGSAAYGLNVTALFRPPNNQFLAKRVLAARTTSMGHLVPSKAGASWALANVMDEGGKVGLLVDQFFWKGTLIEFMGRETLANPLLAKLVRQYECPVYPARCIRLPEGRFRLSIEPPLEIPRDASGNVDQEQLTRSVNACVERWVREYPEQWLWLHKRWRPQFMAGWHQRQKQKMAAKKQKTGR